MTCRMDRNWMSFTVGTEVEVVASRVHALVANAPYHFPTLIAVSAMDT
jgi:hypothetical protein